MISVTVPYLRVNESHQLRVSVSKHLYVLKPGAITHQKKAMDMNLKNYHRTGCPVDPRACAHFAAKDFQDG